MPQDGFTRPSLNQVDQEVLRKRAWFKVMNWSHNLLLLTILSAKLYRIIEGSKMETSYRDIVGVGAQCHVLQSPPQTYALNYGVRKGG